MPEFHCEVLTGQKLHNQRPMRKPAPIFVTLNRLLGWNQHPRNGKVARLPEPIRNRINQMLENGLPYRVIIRNLAETESLPYPLSEMNLSNWFQGGYQDYLHRVMA